MKFQREIVVVTEDEAAHRVGSMIVSIDRHPKTGMLLLHPNEPSVEPHYVRFGVGMSLTTEVDQVLGTGQFVITGKRIIGLLTDGALNDEPMGSPGGRYYVFDIFLSQLEKIHIEKNWRGQITNFVLAAAGDSWYVLNCKAVAILQNDGDAFVVTTRDLINRLTTSSLAGLREP